MIVVSAFDGISCGQQALLELGIKLDLYFAFEIDKYAIKITMKNHPDTIQKGCVQIDRLSVRRPDLLIGGSPCQGFSFAGEMLNFDDPRSKLFFDFVRLRERLNPENFLFENVLMTKKSREIITRYLDVEPIEIDAALVSAQRRKRLYWTDIPGIIQPQDRGILLRDILENGTGVNYDNRGENPRGVYHVEKSNTIVANYYKGIDNHGQRTGVYLTSKQIANAKEAYKAKQWKTGKKTGNLKFPESLDGKSKTLVAQQWAGNRMTVHIDDGAGIRRLTPVECERLQCLPDNYTAGVSNTQRYKMIGNGWNVAVIKHIFSHLNL